MRFLIQRVTKANVAIDGEIVGKINKGFLVLIGVAEEDTEEIADKMVKKLLGLMKVLLVFPDKTILL